jgi:DNA (cytosine-5)-methyltransferase 1
MKHGSLFSGLGGFDLAAEWMGWENIFHCEWMEFPRKVLDYHFPNANSHIDICKTDFKKYANKIDILTGGFPCQPFSMAGKRKGTDDERYLWGEMLRAIQEIKPAFVIAENVAGILSIDDGLVFEQVCLDLEAEGYEVQPFIIPAAAKNAPHRRDRVWFVATNTLSVRLQQCQNGTEMEGGQREICRERNQFTNGIKTNGEISNATNTNSNGLNQCNGNNEKHSSKAGVNAQRDAKQSDVNGNATNPDGRRTQTRQDGEVLGESDTKEKARGFVYDGIQRNATNTKGTRGERECVKGQRQVQSDGRNSRTIPTNFQEFPTQPPICGGDDGLPTELDGITFSKWRSESIKGYGNAIVPQIALEIFKQLEKIYLEL